MVVGRLHFPHSTENAPYEASHRLHPTRRQARPQAADGRGDGRDTSAGRRILQGAREGARRDLGRTRPGLEVRVSTGAVPLIESQRDLEALFARLGSAPLLAVDTEAASFHRFIDRVYLLQISSRDETAV